MENKFITEASVGLKFNAETQEMRIDIRMHERFDKLKPHARGRALAFLVHSLTECLHDRGEDDEVWLSYIDALNRDIESEILAMAHLK